MIWLVKATKEKSEITVKNKKRRYKMIVFNWIMLFLILSLFVFFGSKI
jgi:hypothetical protein